MKKLLSLVLTAVLVLACIPLGSFAVEDGSVELWFEHAAVKAKRTDIMSSGLDTYTVYLAKNDIQGAQIILSSGSVHDGLTMSLGKFENSGVSLETELF